MWPLMMPQPRRAAKVARLLCVDGSPFDRQRDEVRGTIPRARIPAAFRRIAAAARVGQAVGDRFHRCQRVAVHLEDGVVRIAAVRLVAHGPVLVPRAVEAACVRPADGGLSAVALVQRHHAVSA